MVVGRIPIVVMALSVRIVVFCIPGLVLSSNEFIVPGKQANADAGFWPNFGAPPKQIPYGPMIPPAPQPISSTGPWPPIPPQEATTVPSEETTEEVESSGFWPDAKYVMHRRKQIRGSTRKAKVPFYANKENSGWDIYDAASTDASVPNPVPAPVPPPPTVHDDIVLKNFAPPAFLINASDEAKLSFAKIGNDHTLTKKQVRQAYQKWAEAQEDSVKDGYFKAREEHDAMVKKMRTEMLERSKKLPTKARQLFESIQDVHDDDSITVMENHRKVQQLMSDASEETRRQLTRLK